MTVVLSKELARRFTDFLKSGNIDFDVEKYRKLTIVFIQLNSDEKTYVFDILADYVINDNIKKHINSYLDREFYFFDKNEKEEVLNDVVKKLEKNDVSNKIKSFFDEKEEIILDGFFRFRMKDYISYIDSLVLESAMEKATEKEVNEFVKLLKYFVGIGDGICEKVHVYKKAGSYVILDQNGNYPLDEVGVMYEFSDMDYLPEDELLGNLVSIAPKYIIIHGENVSEHDENMKIILKVFENSIEFCGGKCEKCREIRKNENHIPKQ